MHRHNARGCLISGQIIERIVEYIDMIEAGVLIEFASAVERRIEFDPIANGKRIRHFADRADEGPIDRQVLAGKPLKQ